MNWKPITEAPPDRKFWAYHESKGEILPAQLATSLGFKATSLKTYPDLVLCIHPNTGAGFYTKWWIEMDLPPQEDR